MRKTQVFLLMVLAVLLFTAVGLAGQEVDPDFPFPLNDAIVGGIQTVLGIGLMALVQLAKGFVKKLFKNWDSMSVLARHGIMYGVTLLVAAGATAFTLAQMQMLTTARMVLYTVYTWGYINQFWKMLKEVVSKHS